VLDTPEGDLITGRLRTADDPRNPYRICPVIAIRRPHSREVCHDNSCNHFADVRAGLVVGQYDHARPRALEREGSAMSDITGFGWAVIIAAVLFLVASIRTIGLFPTILAITTLFFWFLFKE
jgi:hypothetical protein